MSDFLLEPEDELKALIDDFFVQQQKIGAPQKGPTKKLQLPKAPPLPKDKIEKVQSLALDEIEHVRQAFLNFQDEISDTALYPYLYPHIEEFANIAQTLLDLVNNDIDKSDVSDVGLVDYERLQEVRNRILDQIDKKYKD